ncbi:peptidoglycan-binding domain-containing protein [Streptomyces sp. NPDC047453]|uniref:peptidoglycan-binding domain-containing protein n=1 Tax=Streptomyces sp. NPDC047453 TaxID=3154812 RepID=UPI0033C28EEB
MSTPPGHQQPHGGAPLEPVRVIRPRRTDALAELMREFREYQRDTGGDEDPPGPPVGSVEDAATEELPAAPAGSSAPRGPVPRGPAPRRAPVRAPDAAGRSLRGAAVAVAVAAAALLGFGCALLLPARGEAAGAAAAPPRPSASAAATPTQAETPTATPSADPDGPGTLREGDSGPDVTELQERLLHVPDVYRDGSTGGRYDGELRAAVARFQLWYGISGDETGVYGDDTRRALESRTTADGG